MRISDWSSDVCSSDLDEAVENAIKIARAATRRSGVIAFTGGFHGRTIMTSALTGKVAPYKAQFGPMPGGVHHIPFPTLTGGSVEESLRALSYVFAADMPPEDVAAIILQPVPGAGGFHVPPTEPLTPPPAICHPPGHSPVTPHPRTPS